MKHRRGLVIGKFYPPHLGHSHLIAAAEAGCDEVVVIVCWRPDDTIPGPLRAKWIREMHPRADVRVIDDTYDENDTQVWARNTLEWLNGPPDVVYTSEAYGDPYAAAMGCLHICVDRARVAVPCAGRELRRDPYANWQYLTPGARAWYVRRVCVVGAESTGTTTLAEALAARFQTVWVPEYGREYSEVKMRAGEADWHTDEFTMIATRQCAMEDAAAREANRVLVCDTNAFATTLWHRRYMNSRSPAVEKIAAGRRYGLYLLTGDEIPFVQDGLRDGEHIRHEMHRWFEEALAAQSVPWLLLRGSREERLAWAAEAVEGLLH